MTNGDKVKAARSGGDLRYSQKMNAIHNAARLAHDNQKRVDGLHHQLRRFEDAGYGVSTGKQHEHEENMRFYKKKLDEKKQKAKAFRRQIEAESQLADDYDAGFTHTAAAHEEGADKLLPTLRFAVGTRVQCRFGPAEWAAGQVVKQVYREDTWPRGRVVPYQVCLDDGELIFVPRDCDEVVRAFSGRLPMPHAAAPITPNMGRSTAHHETERWSSSCGAKAGQDCGEAERIVATYLY